MELQSLTSGLVKANNTELYYELQGSGPTIMFISGATGDAGHFTRVGSHLADEFTVLTYDRRGNSRSPCPADWATTSADEQGDDAAGLLEALHLTPAIVFGTSGGGVIGLNLIVRYPHLVRGAIIHEPPLLETLSHPEEAMAVLQPLIEGGMAAGGPRGAVEAFVRFAAGPATFERIEPDVRERMLANGETLFGIEFGRIENYRPADEVLAGIKFPVHVMAGTESPLFLRETCRWLASRLKVEVVTLPGGHAPYLDHPKEVAETIRPFFREIFQVSR